MKGEFYIVQQKDFEIWLYRAKQDWIAIQAMLSFSEQSWSLISFHAQQAAEKTLKAFFVDKLEKPKRIHDLEDLLKSASQYESSLATFKADCNFLTQFAVDARYGDIDDEFSEENAREAVAVATRICEAISARITHDQTS